MKLPAGSGWDGAGGCRGTDTSWRRHAGHEAAGTMLRDLPDLPDLERAYHTLRGIGYATSARRMQKQYRSGQKDHRGKCGLRAQPDH